MRFVTLILALAVIPTGCAQTITIVQPEAAGVELIGSQSPDFQTFLQAAISPDVVKQFSAWLPYTVVLRNNSPQPLVAYHMKWALDPPRKGGWGNGEVSGTGPEGYLNPGKALVFMLGFNLTDAPRPDKQAGIQRQGASMLSALQRGNAPTIFLDSAIFASGQFIGPDTDGNFAHDAASFTAWRPIDRQVQSELQAGEPWDTIAGELAQIANQTVPGSSRATTDWNAQVRKVQARRLLKLYQRSGLQAVLDLLKQQVQQPEILVHR